MLFLVVIGIYLIVFIYIAYQTSRRRTSAKHIQALRQLQAEYKYKTLTNKSIKYSRPRIK